MFNNCCQLLLSFFYYCCWYSFSSLSSDSSFFSIFMSSSNQSSYYIAKHFTRHQKSSAAAHYIMIVPSSFFFLVLVGSVRSLTTVSKRLISANAFKGYLSLRATVNDKVEVEEYFNNEGFNRWNKIYSNSDEVNKVQLDIRNGHQQTIDKVLGWLDAEKLSDKTICDAGCGVGSLSIPLAKKFRKVFASDISAAMTKEAADRAKQEKIKNIEFKVPYQMS